MGFCSHSYVLMGELGKLLTLSVPGDYLTHLKGLIRVMCISTALDMVPGDQDINQPIKI